MSAAAPIDLAAKLTALRAAEEKDPDYIELTIAGVTYQIPAIREVDENGMLLRFSNPSGAPVSTFTRTMVYDMDGNVSYADQLVRIPPPSPLPSP